MGSHATVALHRVMAPGAATALTATAAPAMTSTVTQATVAVDADTGAAVFAYLPMPDVSGLRQAVMGIPLGASSFTTFGTSSDSFIPGHSVIMGYADRLVNLLNAITPGCAEPVAPFYGLVNRSNVHLYHRDGGSLSPLPVPVPAGTPWAAMVYLRSGMTGGHLHIPEYGATLACDDGWGVFLPTSELLHGVTPMTPHGSSAYRYSILYGSLPGARECFGGEPPATAGWDTQFIQRLKAAGI